MVEMNSNKLDIQYLIYLLANWSNISCRRRGIILEPPTCKRES